MDQIQSLIENALAASGADDCIVIGDERSETNLRFADNGLTTNGQMASRSLTVISTVDDAVGVVSRAITSTADVAALVRDSEAAARAATAADDVAPLVPAGTADPGWDRDPATTTVDVFADVPPQFGRVFADARANDRAWFGFAEHIVTSTYLGTSTGLRRRIDQPTGRLEVNVKSADGTRSVWDGKQTRDFTDIDVTQVDAGLTRKLDWAAKRIDLPAGRYETLLPPTAVADLMIVLYWAMSARDAEEGRSVFAGPDGTTKLGRTLTDQPLTLYSDPAADPVQCAPIQIARSSTAGVQSVFDNGAPVERTAWIDQGRLTDLVRSRAWAARDGSTARPEVDNLLLDGGGTADLDAMIASTERGLLLTSLWYIREVDPQTLLVTGLTRDGVFLVEDGKVAGAVNNYRFNESPVGLLSRVREVGASEPTLPREWNDWFTRAVMPPLRVADFNMSTVSKAS